MSGHLPFRYLSHPVCGKLRPPHCIRCTAVAILSTPGYDLALQRAKPRAATAPLGRPQTNPCSTLCYLRCTLCYMKRYGVRELRQNATDVLREVARGETVIITNNGHPVAQMTAPTRDPWSALIAAGEITPARTGPRTILTRTAQPITPPHQYPLDDMRRGER